MSRPRLGRLFTPDEARGGPHPVAMLANAYWRRQFNSDPAIVGKAIELNGTPITVVGVLPESFDFGAVFSPGAKVDLFTPLNLNLERDWGNIVTLIGRLKPGVTVAQALDDANRVAPNMYFNVKYPEYAGPLQRRSDSGNAEDYVTGKLRHSLIALWCAVGAILLIAGVNLSNLLLARAARAPRSSPYAEPWGQAADASCASYLPRAWSFPVPGRRSAWGWLCYFFRGSPIRDLWRCHY